MNKYFPAPLLIIFLFTLEGMPALASSRTSDTLTASCLQSAGKQLDEALVLMQKHYYKKDIVSWDSLITAAHSRIARSRDCAEAFETINWCFSQIRESHSFIMPTNTAAVYNYDTVMLKRKPHISQLVGDIKGEFMADKGIAYLNLPWIGTTDSALCAFIADSIQQLIAQLDRSAPSKWIIDLRQNKGGNCWPMLAGIGPLLGEGICAYFVSADSKVPISYRNGASMQGNRVRCQSSGSGYKLKQIKNQIIVLTGPKTSSSGEIVALAFKGKESAQLYGEPTAGLTTANTTYMLSDKSMLVLTICMEADRSGKIYQGPIAPDVNISASLDNSLDDAAKSAAIMWLHIQ